MGLQGRPWTGCADAEKSALRFRFDASRADRADPGRSAFEHLMNVIGLRAPRPHRSPKKRDRCSAVPFVHFVSVGKGG